jgi:outer membrane protein assembly factor BamA
MFPNSWLGRSCAFWIIPLYFAAVLLPLRGWTQAAPGEEIIKAIEVQHRGPRAVSDDLVRANIRVKAGDPYSKLNIDDDVRNLYATGYFHYIDVQQIVEPDGVRLVYRVQARPILSDIRFVGNERFSTRRLSRKVTSKIGQPLDEAQVFKDAQAIKESYEKAGFLKTSTGTPAERPSPSRSPRPASSASSASSSPAMPPSRRRSFARW